MSIEMLALGSFALMVVMWAVLPSRLHRGNTSEDEE
jgi:hypothetical protein